MEIISLYTCFMEQLPEALSKRNPPQLGFLWQANPHSTVPDLSALGTIDTSSVWSDEKRFQT